MAAGFLSRLFFCVSLILLAWPALAQDHDRKEWNPPTRYDHPFKGTLIEESLPRKDVMKLCPRLLDQFEIPGEVTRGCSILVRPDVCIVIYIDEPYHGTLPEAVKRHELGHCNGWGADHPS